MRYDVNIAFSECVPRSQLNEEREKEKEKIKREVQRNLIN